MKTNWITASGRSFKRCAKGANITVNFHLDTEQEAFDKSDEYKHLKAAHVQREEAGETKWLGLENDKQLEFSFFYGKDGE